METNKVGFVSIKSKVLAQITAGIFGGTILGITGLFAMMNFGGNYGGCGTFIDSIFGTAGYESCGAFGSIAGILIGITLGIVIIIKSKMIKYLRVALWLSIGSFLLPFLYAVIALSPQFENGIIFIVLSTILAFVIVSAILSTFIIRVINWKNSRKA
jgi:hypothetical protein